MYLFISKKGYLFATMENETKETTLKVATVAINHTWSVPVFNKLQKEGRKKGFKNFQNYITELARLEFIRIEEAENKEKLK